MNTHGLAYDRTKLLLALFAFIIWGTLLAPRILSAASTDWFNKPVTITSQDQQLHEVLGAIADQAEISIYYDQQLANDRINANYRDTSALKAVKRIFSGRNKIILTDENEKAIIVKTFGTKTYIRAGNSAPSKQTRTITLQELDELHQLQEQEFQNTLESNDHVLPTGMKVNELNSLHAQQEKDFARQLAAGDKTLQELHEQQELEFAVEKAQSDRSLQAMHEEQEKAFLDSKQADAQLTTGSGITMAELQEMHRQQELEFEKSLETETITLR